LSETRGDPAGRLRHELVLAAVLFTVAVAQYSAVFTYFAQDDVTHLLRAAGGGAPVPWPRPLSEGLAFRLGYRAFGLAPFGYHALNLGLHLIDTIAVYALARWWIPSRLAAGAAAVLFGCSSIAFTPLHWATGVIELLAAAFLLAATLLHLESRRRGDRWRWAAAVTALAAMLSKETAAGWILVVAFLEADRPRAMSPLRAMAPATLSLAVFLIVLIASGRPFHVTEAYAMTGAPASLARSLSTYAAWSVAIWDPIRDVIAVPDSRDWMIGVPVLLATVALLVRSRGANAKAARFGVVWWLAFLLPVLPLLHHAYLYYLYIPWTGAAIALAAAGHGLLARFRHGALIGASLLSGFVILESRNVTLRETATREALPVDRTMRDALLLSHALPALDRADLPRGTRVVFVNPLPGRRFDLMTGTPTRPEDEGHRRSYFPLEAAMRGGETFRLFLPDLVYGGFRTTIPPGMEEDVEYFHYEQRGWLERWGNGPGALMRQARVQMDGRHWAAAESTLRRIRESER
jgi:hypothetical protein